MLDYNGFYHLCYFFDETFWVKFIISFTLFCLYCSLRFETFSPYIFQRWKPCLNFVAGFIHVDTLRKVFLILIFPVFFSVVNVLILSYECLLRSSLLSIQNGSSDLVVHEGLKLCTGTQNVPIWTLLTVWWKKKRSKWRGRGPLSHKICLGSMYDILSSINNF